MPQAALPFIPAIIGAGGSIVSSILGKNAAKGAATSQANAQGQVIQNTRDAVAAGQGQLSTGQDTIAAKTGDANDVLSRSAQTQLGMYAPYQQAGSDALGSLQQLAGAGGPLDQKFSFNPTDLQNDPGYQFTLQQGQQAIQRAAAAKGGLFSGSTLKSLAGYTTGLADTTFGNAFNRAASTFDINRSSALSRISSLQGLAGLGYGATTAGANAVGQTSAQQAGYTANSGNAIAGLGRDSADLSLRGAGMINSAITGQGDAQAAGRVGSTNATINGIAGITNAASKGIGDFLSQRNLTNLIGGLSSSKSAGYPGGDYGGTPGSDSDWRVK